MRAVYNFSIFLTSILIGFLCFELSLRLFEINDDWSVTKKANILRNVSYQYDLNGLYPSDTDSVDYKRNEFGLRDDCRDPSDIAILTIGGSTTDQRYVDFKHTYQKTLQNRLQSNLGKNGCVTNAGVDGHSTWGHIFSFKHWFPLIPNLSPDYVLLYIGINDTNILRPEAPIDGFDLNTNNSIKSWLKQFRTVQYLRPIFNIISKSSKGNNAPYNGHFPKKYTENDYTVSTLNESTPTLTAVKLEHFRRNLSTMLNYIREMDATAICISQPHRTVSTIGGKLRGIENTFGAEFSGLDVDYVLQSINHVLEMSCGENYLNLYDEVFQSEHFYDGVHTTNIGSEYIGNLIADFFLERNLQFDSR